MAAVVGAAIPADLALNGQLSQRRHLFPNQLSRLADLQWTRSFIGQRRFFGVRLRGLVKQTALRKCGIKWGTFHFFESLGSIVRQSWRRSRMVVKMNWRMIWNHKYILNRIKNNKKAN